MLYDALGTEECKKFNTNLDSVTTDTLLEFPTGIGIRSSAVWLYISRRRTCTSSKKRYNPIRNSSGGRKRKITGGEMGGKTVDGGTREEHPLDRLASIPQSGPADRSKPSNAEHHRHYYSTTMVPCTTRSANYEMDPGVTRPINLPTKFVPTFRSERERERERWSYFLLDEKRTAATCIVLCLDPRLSRC